MAKIRLYPAYGTREEARSIKFEIYEMSSKDFLLEAEDITHGKTVAIDSVEASGNNRCMGIIHLDIPEKSSQSIISIFVYIKNKTEDGKYKTSQICPVLFSIREKSPDIGQDKIDVDPLFVGQDGVCSVRAWSKPNRKISLSINKKYFNIMTNEDGEGSIQIRVKDVIDRKQMSVVQKIPVYVYNFEDNYTQRLFSGSYINILPTSIAVHSSIDPRCDITDPLYVQPGAWTIPSECIVDPVEPEVEDVDPVIPTTGIPSSCDAENGTVSIDSRACKIYGKAISLLNNGTIVWAYLSPDNSYKDPDDEEFNINKVFIGTSDSSVDVQVVANQDVAIAPKDTFDNFRIYVQHDIWNFLSFLDNPSGSSNPSSESLDVYVVFFSQSTGFQRVKIISREIDEYSDSYILVGEVGETSVFINNWLFCVNSVFYYAEEAPLHKEWQELDYLSLNLLPFEDQVIYDPNHSFMQIVNISIASNPYYIAEENSLGRTYDSYIYIVAEGIIDGHSQLFFSSIGAYRENGSSQDVFDRLSWKQLTSLGDNKNPKIYMDKSNTLHVFWESDRSGSNQIYYGVLGASAKSQGNMVFSSILDKFAEYYLQTQKSFVYTDSQLLISNSNDPSSFPEYSTHDLVGSTWEVQQGENGFVQETHDSNYYLNGLRVSVRESLNDNAMAFSRLQIQSDLDNPSETTNNPYSQFNFQVSFNFSATILQTSPMMEEWDGIALTDEGIDNLYDLWRRDFQTTIDSDINNGQPIYIKNGKRFAIGRRDHVHDRIVPFFGSYKADDVFDNPSSMFQIKLLKEDTNVKDFVFGVMLEKTYFEKVDIDSGDQEVDVIYTGKAKFISFIKTEDTNDVSNYFIIKEFPEEIDITTPQLLTFILGYTKIESNEVIKLLDKMVGSYDNRYAGNFVFCINGIPKFSYGFVSDLSDIYNYFDIGFGVPYGGHYVSDKMLASKFVVFDNVGVDFFFTDIMITSPTYTPNSNLVSIPDTTKDWSKLRIFDDEDPNPSNVDMHDHSFNLLSLGFRGSDEIIFWTEDEETQNESEVNGTNSREFDTRGIDKIMVKYTPVSSGYGLGRIIIGVVDGETLYDSGYIDKLSAIQDSYWMDSEDCLVISLPLSNYGAINITISGAPSSASHGYYAFFMRSYSSNNFLQIPITFDGINQSVKADVSICDDINIVWEGNKNYYWNIYTSNSYNKLRPFRFDTQITNTNSNSILPDISVCRNGKRMITWHDNREGDYGIYAARSLSGYGCSDDTCEKKMVDKYEEEITECLISLNITTTSNGVYKFSLEFYEDKDLSSLYKTIEMGENIDRWFLDGVSMGESVSYSSEGVLLGIALLSGTEYSISYTPDKDDGIFDKVLYVKLSYSIT